jgi:hypothetical protein
MGIAVGFRTTLAKGAAFVVVPSVITNFWHFLAGQHRSFVARQISPMLLTMCPDAASSTTSPHLLAKERPSRSRSGNRERIAHMQYRQGLP